MKILIIGGNRFVGKKLALEMLGRGHEVTILNRGRLNAQSGGDGLGPEVKRLVCDRDAAKLPEILDHFQSQPWDIVYDHVCFTQSQAKFAVDVFRNRTKRYVFISSLSIYDEGLGLKESQFDPSNYIPMAEVTDSMADYKEAKRQCECIFTKSGLNVVLIRFPLIVGADDYTGRFKFHIDHIRNSQPFFAPNPQAKISFIDSSVAARALADLSAITFRGPLNLSSPDSIAIEDFFTRIKNIHGGGILIPKVEGTEDDKKFDISPYGFSHDFHQDVSLALSLGIHLPPHSEWLDELIRIC